MKAVIWNENSFPFGSFYHNIYGSTTWIPLAFERDKGSVQIQLSFQKKPVGHEAGEGRWKLLPAASTHELRGALRAGVSLPRVAAPIPGASVLAWAPSTSVDQQNHQSKPGLVPEKKTSPGPAPSGRPFCTLVALRAAIKADDNSYSAPLGTN